MNWLTKLRQYVALAIMAAVVIAPLTQVVRLVVEYPRAAFDVALPFVLTAVIVWAFGTTLHWLADRQQGACVAAEELARIDRDWPKDAVS